ncbi:branched-chain amino acid ABC transporter permease [Undibacterium sp. Di24W]|uniref:branched-chain amino acid ABC transporter permease n=1 Tax=Undibacterium sp. Di24W TaxID=3413033 RepID=UPI003BF3749B
MLSNTQLRFQSSLSMVCIAVACLAILCLPGYFSSGKALNFVSQACIAAVFALSFNMLLGQTGMLSFGHAAYSGLGGFVAIHAINKISDGSLNLPLSLVPMVGAFAGALFGSIFGWISSKKSGITFSMISLGIAELVFASALMFPGFFGGEGGISANRVSGEPVFGVTFGPQGEVCYLIISWTIIAALAMYFIQKTPLGKLAEAVRDNSERVAFIGFDPRWIRFLMLVLSSFFAGIAGALSAINFEIVSAENLSAVRSGTVLLFTYIGGISFFLGPVVGAVLGVFMSVFLSELTPAWQLYMGILFILVVVKAPQGLTGLAVDFFQAFQQARIQARLQNLFSRCAVYALIGSLFSIGVILLVEMLYRLRFQSGDEQILRVFGLELNPHNLFAWGMATLFMGASICIKSLLKAKLRGDL